MPVSVLLVAPLGMAPDSFPAPLAAPLSLPLFPPQAARAIIVRDQKSQGVFFYITSVFAEEVAFTAARRETMDAAKQLR